jgi:hypothetical protein
VETGADQVGSTTKYLRAILFLFSAGNFGSDINKEHPKWIMGDLRADEQEQLALRVAAEVPDDAEAVAAIRAGGGKRRVLRQAAAWMRSKDSTWDYRARLRAARLLKAAADGGSPVPFTAEQEARFRAVERLEALPPDEAFAVLAAEVPDLRALEHKVASSVSEPGWQDRDAAERVREVCDELAQLVGKSAAGSPLVRSAAAFGRARVYLLRKAGLLADDDG